VREPVRRKLTPGALTQSVRVCLNISSLDRIQFDAALSGNFAAYVR